MASEKIIRKIKSTIRYLFETKTSGYTNDFIGKYMEALTTLILNEYLKVTADATRDAVRAQCYTVFFEMVANDYQHLTTQRKMEVEAVQILLSLK